MYVCMYVCMYDCLYNLCLSDGSRCVIIGQQSTATNTSICSSVAARISAGCQLVDELHRLSPWCHVLQFTYIAGHF